MTVTALQGTKAVSILFRPMANDPEGTQNVTSHAAKSAMIGGGCDLWIFVSFGLVMCWDPVGNRWVGVVLGGFWFFYCYINVHCKESCFLSRFISNCCNSIFFVIEGFVFTNIIYFYFL